MYNVKNKIIVITGASGVLCSAFAKEIASYGGQIALIGRNIENLEKVQNEIINNGGIAKSYCADVTDKESLENAHSLILNELGKCDILINGAGGNNPKASTAKEYFCAGDDSLGANSFFDIGKDSFTDVVELNLIGTVLPCQIFMRDMITREGCCVLNVSSMNYLTPLTKIAAYSAAKSAVSNFTQWLAVHFANAGIRVNAIAPGFFVSKQNYDLLFDKNGEPTPRTNKIISATPMKRFGKPEELLGTVMFLIDNTKSGFITGQILAIDGGFSAYSGV